MTVYLDQMRHYSAHGHEWWCHMVADSEDELHRMAKAIGLRRSWYQEGHYDICSFTKRQRALDLGAQEVSTRMIAAKRRALLGNLQSKEAEQGTER